MRNVEKLPKLKARNRDSHKGNYGRVLVIAGSTGMTGAAYLSSKAALRSGAGLVTLGIPESLNAIMEVKLTCVMTHPLPETASGSFSKSAEKDILKLAEVSDVVIIGPGVSQHPETRELICGLLQKITIPIVLDADGLNAITEKLHLLNETRNDVVITPHPGEFVRLMHLKSTAEVQMDRIRCAENFITSLSQNNAKNTKSDKSDIVLVLKGSGTIVINHENLYVNSTGNPGMASGGSGDVLSGIIGALIGQGYSTYEAAQLGVYIHGFAGDLAAERYGEVSMIATDLINFLPEAFNSATFDSETK